MFSRPEKGLAKTVAKSDHEGALYKLQEKSWPLQVKNRYRKTDYHIFLEPAAFNKTNHYR